MVARTYVVELLGRELAKRWIGAQFLGCGQPGLAGESEELFHFFSTCRVVKRIL
jgi:hypothetical protein